MLPMEATHTSLPTVMRAGLFGSLPAARVSGPQSGSARMRSACPILVKLRVSPSALPTALVTWVPTILFPSPLIRVGGTPKAPSLPISSMSMVSRVRTTLPVTAALSTCPKHSWRMTHSPWALLAREDLIERVHDHRIVDDQGGYGQVVTFEKA